jgi:predicted HTH transcriptional regulator
LERGERCIIRLNDSYDPTHAHQNNTKGYMAMLHKNMFRISRQAAHKELKALMELGVIKSQGVGRATYYVLD